MSAVNHEEAKNASNLSAQLEGNKLPKEKNATENNRKTNGTRARKKSTSKSTDGPINGHLRERPVINTQLHGKQQARRSSSTVLSRLGQEDLSLVKSHAELVETANGVLMLARNLAKATIHLDVRNIMIVTKAKDNSLVYLTREMVEWILDSKKDITVYVDAHLRRSKRFHSASILEHRPNAKSLLKYWDKKLALKSPEKFDLVITLGGDGTVLHVSNMFQRVVPPVISFALGSLGFLTNFQFEHFRENVTSVLESGVRANFRMRFTCRVHKADGSLVCEQQVLNELVIDRGPSPYVTQLELYGDGELLTIAQADGLIIATPTGSTAYSLSAGGSLVHPGVNAISVTPICPHTLSFRPILLPDGMFLKIKVPTISRSTAWASFDGKVRTEMCKGDYVTIQASPFPFPTVISSKTEYIDSVSRNLNWNVRETQKPLTSFLSESNQKRYRNHNEAEKKLDNLHISTVDEGKFDIEYDGNAESSGTMSDAEEDDEMPFLPSPGSGINTPPSNRISFQDYHDRACFAHPKARITLDEDDFQTKSSSDRSSESW